MESLHAEGVEDSKSVGMFAPIVDDDDVLGAAKGDSGAMGGPER
ncbi:hypothetical protein MICRO80W_70028 [Micrococcus luteus]|nr:hypothetical protein MICRO80W_70028 [Micrococcus luteus]